MQLVKFGLQQSSEIESMVRLPQGSVLRLVLFAIYCSLVANAITDHSVQFHQCACDTQLHLVMCCDNTAAGLSVLIACTADVRHVE